MLKLMDRQLVLGYFKAYFICLISILSLYVVVDLFMNLDDFTHHSHGFSEVLRHIGLYYGCHIPKYFDQLCEAIVLLAAMFTVAWMQRNNEQLPLLSAGVSTHRVVLPVLLSAWTMLSLTILNQEFVIPRLANRLLFDKDDPNGEKEQGVKGAFEPNLIHIHGDKAIRKGMVVRKFRCTIPENLAGNFVHLTAEAGQYVPGPGRGEWVSRQGGWELTGTKPADLETWDPKVLEVIDSGHYFLHTTVVDFDELTRRPNWFTLSSTWQLYEELEKPESTRVSSMAVLFHERLTRPILGMLLVFLGLSIILRDQNRNVFISAGTCLVLCGIFFAAHYACKMLGEADYLSPALAAWLPVLFFGPLAIVLFDAAHT
jgi:lipopolysaccharide export system permease protein